MTRWKKTHHNQLCFRSRFPEVKKKTPTVGVCMNGAIHSSADKNVQFPTTKIGLFIFCNLIVLR